MAGGASFNILDLLGFMDEFDAEGPDYDYKTAEQYRMRPDETGHWSSRVPQTGLLLKGRGHPTWHKTLKGEEEAGYEIVQFGNRYYSFPKRK
jgi:hypothetical protein